MGKMERLEVHTLRVFVTGGTVRCLYGLSREERRSSWSRGTTLREGCVNVLNEWVEVSS